MLHDRGEEFLTKYLFTETATKPTSITVGLYNDSTDTLTETSDVGSITTEPNTGSYAPLTFTFGTTDFTAEILNGDWNANYATKTFALDNTTGTVDSFFIILAFNGNGDSVVTDHLFITERLRDSNGNPTTYDLGQQSSMDFDITTAIQ